jgi:hypothetical protein
MAGTQRRMNSSETGRFFYGHSTGDCMRLALMLALVVTMAGCKKIVSQEYLTPHQEVREVGCEYTGFCYTCGIGFDGEYGCGFKMSSSCDGRQQALVSLQLIRTHYDDGTERLYEDMKIIERKGTCR